MTYRIIGIILICAGFGLHFFDVLQFRGSGFLLGITTAIGTGFLFGVFKKKTA